MSRKSADGVFYDGAKLRTGRVRNPEAQSAQQLGPWGAPPFSILYRKCLKRGCWAGAGRVPAARCQASRKVMNVLSGLGW